MNGASNPPSVLALKLATRDAVEACGGYAAASGFTKAQKSQLHRGTDRNSLETVTIRDALALDEVSMTRGGPFILREYAQRLGCALIVLPNAEVDDTGLARSFLMVTADMGDVARKVDEALRDGKLDEHEKGPVLKEMDELIEHAVAFRHMVANHGGPDVRTAEDVVRMAEEKS